MHIAHPYRLLWLLVMMLAGTQPLRSQTAREEIAADVTLSGYYLTAYPGPLQDTAMIMERSVHSVPRLSASILDAGP